jgi:uncharacterized protein YbaR (Trm112 family)
MSAVRGTAGSTRTCPHCKATILESASVCPACRHHLRFDESANLAQRPKISPLHVEGTITPPAGGGAWEYTMVLSIRNDRGEEIARQVIGVGALFPDEQRTFSLAVEMTEATGARAKRRH